MDTNKQTNSQTNRQELDATQNYFHTQIAPDIVTPLCLRLFRYAHTQLSHLRLDPITRPIIKTTQATVYDRIYALQLAPTGWAEENHKG